MDTWWTTFLYKKYKHPQLVYQDIEKAVSVFTDLRPGVDTCVLESATQKQLLTLSGTIPISYKGNTYNIPVSLWIMDTHPYAAPHVFVRPTETMRICPNAYVSDRGNVSLPYLSDWKYPDSELASLVQILSLEFGEKCPVASKIKDSTSSLSSLLPFLTEEKYQYPDRLLQEIANIINYYQNLTANFSVYATSTTTPKELLQLTGTIPVMYKGSKFNIPVCLWIMPDYPVHPPDVYVCPTSTMRLNPSNTVDTMGKVTLPYLQQWKVVDSDLLSVIQVLIHAFGEVSPVFSLTGSDGNLLRFYQDTRFNNQYQAQNETKLDVLNAVKKYIQLTPKFDWVVDVSTGLQKELLNLEGTIPVSYKGNTYNIPILIWLRETHPSHSPLVYVRPTSEMVIHPSKHVDTGGKVDLPYLQHWKYPDSNLSTLIHAMVTLFANQIPVFAKPPPALQSPGSSSSVFPSTWIHVDSDKHVFPVDQTSEEFFQVRNDFLSSLDVQTKTVTIVKIERIQIRSLYKQYLIEKEQVDTEHPGEDNERSLWHGTSDAAIPNINRYGFNRSYCGKNATMYGQGVYFAVRSSYSACNTYSPPDSQGIKYIYRAKVLTGRFTKGNPSMKDTPLLDPARSVRFHSTTDNVTSPSLFASFRDVHSYPEYLVAFRMSSN